jgi:hypothetical protein
MAKTSDEKIQQVQDRLLELGDEVLELLYEQAKGSYFVVGKHVDKRDKPPPKKGELVAEVTSEVESICTKCKQPKFKAPPVLWEVWKRMPDVAALKHLHEQIVGRAKQKAQEQVDPEIIVVFGDIDSLSCEQERMSEERVKELEGSPGRTPEKDYEARLGITDLE